MLEVSDTYLLHLCLQAGKHQSSVKVHFNSVLLSSWGKIGKILSKKKRRRSTNWDPLKYLFPKNLSRQKHSRQFSFSALQ